MDIQNKTEQEIKDIVDKIGTELYYDLKDKYITLQDKYNKLVEVANRMYIGPQLNSSRKKKAERKAFNFALNLCRIYIGKTEGVATGKIMEIIREVEKLKIPPNTLVSEHLAKVKLHYQNSKETT